MAKVIIATANQQSVVEAASKAVKTAPHSTMGTLSGTIKEALEQGNKIEEDIDKSNENIENVEFAIESQNWQLSAPGAKATNAAVKELIKAQKAAAKATAKVRQAAEKVEKELHKARIQQDDQSGAEDSDESEEDSE